MTTTTSSGDIRALDLLIRQYPPMVGSRPPYWRPMPAPCAGEVYEPAWNWRSRQEAPEGTRVRVLDANGAYLAAASSVEVAHGRLVRCPRVAFERNKPGYWLVDIDPDAWTYRDVVSPLGTALVEGPTWLTTPTVALLADLTDLGLWPGLDIRDAWLGQYRVRLRRWATALRDIRAEIMTRGDQAAYDRFKVAYSAAVTTMQVDRKSAMFRPDWSQHIRTQHAATMWRRMFRAAHEVGHPPLGAGTVDEIAWTDASVARFRVMAGRGFPAPVILDETGVKLGAFKTKQLVPASVWNRRR